jgi:hypothetical protein
MEELKDEEEEEEKTNKMNQTFFTKSSAGRGG